MLALYGLKTRLTALVNEQEVDLNMVKLGSGFVQNIHKSHKPCFREGGDAAAAAAAGGPLELVFAPRQRPYQAFNIAREALNELNVDSGPAEVVYIELFFFQDPDLAQRATQKRNMSTHEEKFRVVLSKLEAAVKTECERFGVKFGPPFGWTTENGLTCNDVQLKLKYPDEKGVGWIHMRKLLDLMMTQRSQGGSSRGITETAFVDSGLCESIDGIIGDGKFLQLEQVRQGVEHLFDEDGLNLVRIKKDSYKVHGFK